MKYTPKLKRSIFVLALFVSLLGGACKKQLPPADFSQTTLIAQLAKEPDLTVFSAAVKRLGLDSLLTNVNFTIFAPVDSAFSSEGLTVDRVRSMDSLTLANLVGYHIAYGKLNTANFALLAYQQLKTLDTSASPFLIRNNYGVFLNGVMVIGADINSLNGVLHKINRIAHPPAGDMLSTIQSRPELSMTYKALQLTMPRDYTLQQSLTVWTSTFFAPDNTAWAAEGYPDSSSLLVENPNVLGRFLLTALIGQSRYFSCDLLGSAILSNFTGGGLLVEVDGISLKGPNDIYYRHLVDKDLVAANGVIHIVDGLFH